jgi:hypothetical protein
MFIRFNPCTVGSVLSSAPSPPNANPTLSWIAEASGVRDAVAGHGRVTVWPRVSVLSLLAPCVARSRGGARLAPGRELLIERQQVRLGGYVARQEHPFHGGHHSIRQTSHPVSRFVLRFTCSQSQLVPVAAASLPAGRRGCLLRPRPPRRPRKCVPRASPCQMMMATAPWFGRADVGMIGLTAGAPRRGSRVSQVP